MNREIRLTSLSFLWIILLCVFLNSTGSAHGDQRRDYYSQQAHKTYYNQFQNARTFGMAGSSVVTSQDSSAVLGNPAGLGMMEGGDVSITYSRDEISGHEHTSYKSIEQESDKGQALLTVPIGPVLNDLPNFGNLGVGWSGYDGDSSDSIDSQADGNRVHLAYSKALSRMFSLGYGLSYFDDNFDSDLAEYSRDNGFRHTFGAQGALSERTTLGGTFFFTHGDYDFEGIDGQDGESDSEEVGIELGVSYRLAQTLLAASADYQHYDTDGEIESDDPRQVFGGDEEGDSFGVRVGAEHQFNDHFLARAGYRYAGIEDYEFDREELEELSGSAKYNAWSLGAGFVIPLNANYFRSVNVDYGVEYRAVGHDDWQHVVTVSTPFNLCE